MTGEIHIQCINEKGKEGISVRTNLQQVGVEDRIQVLSAIANALKISPSLAHTWSVLYGTGLTDLMFGMECKYDHSVAATPQEGQERPRAFRDLDELFREILGGGMK